MPMFTRTLLFLAICLLKDVSFTLGFKIPGDNLAEMPPRVRPDILQKADERGYSVDGASPVLASRGRARQHRKQEEKTSNAKGKDPAKYSNPKYWNEVEWRNQQERRLDKSIGNAWKAIAIVALAAICSPVLFPVLFASVVYVIMFASFIIVVCGPWAIAGYALYKSIELFVEGNKPTPPFEKDENGNRMNDGETDKTKLGHMAFQQ